MLELVVMLWAAVVFCVVGRRSSMKEDRKRQNKVGPVMLRLYLKMRISKIEDRFTSLSFLSVACIPFHLHHESTYSI
jgi:hypothetical protein